VKQRLPRHLLLKSIRRARLTLDDQMEARLNAIHRTLPQISKRKLARIARKDPRILEITPKTFKSNVERTSNLLNALLPAYFKLAQQLPALIYQDPWSLRLKLRRIAKGLHITTKDLMPVIWKKPTLLSRSENSIFSAIDAFASRFDIEPLLARKFFLKHPSLWTVTLVRIEGNITETARLLDIPPAAYIKAALSQPQLFYQSPNTIHRNVTEAARNLNLPFLSYLEIALGQPSLFSRSPDGMRRKARLIKNLMRYTREERSFEEFLHCSKSALTYSPEHIMARCLIARWNLSTQKTGRLLSMPNSTATVILRAHLKDRMGKAAYPVYRRWKSIGMLTAV
jgi:hypothetical protein